LLGTISPTVSIPIGTSERSCRADSITWRVTGKTTTHLNKAEPVQNSTELAGASSRAVLVTPEMPPMQPIRIINGAGGSGICSFSPDTQHVGAFYTLNTSAPDLSADSIIDQLFVGLDGQ